jgi:hypothetical protein
VSRSRLRAPVAAALTLALVAAAGTAGCSGDEAGITTALQRTAPARESTSPARKRAVPRQPRLTLARCSSTAAPGCRSASGRILYVERVDPDGDGDAHFVLLSRESITGPGLTVVDVRRDLRPRPLPGPGDRISAAGPVYRGSHGQRQIEATEIHVTR